MTGTAPLEPMPEGAPAPPAEPSPSQLLDEMQRLGDLFKRRLLDDAQKRELYDRLYAELEAARRATEAERALPMLRDLFHILDRLDAYAGPDPGFVASVFGELLELLHRQGVDPLVVDVGTPFDPAGGEIVRTDRVEDPAWNLAVLKVLRRGYRQSERVVRPAQLVVGRYEGADAGDVTTPG